MAIQAAEVDKVKRSESGMIVDPITMRPGQRIHEVTGKVPTLVYQHDELSNLRPLGDITFDTDDVFTTGATVDAATRCLLRAGAAAVDVLTLARVVRPAP